MVIKDMALKNDSQVSTYGAARHNVNENCNFNLQPKFDLYIIYFWYQICKIQPYNLEGHVVYALPSKFQLLILNMLKIKTIFFFDFNIQHCIFDLDLDIKKLQGRGLDIKTIWNQLMCNTSLVLHYFHIGNCFDNNRRIFLHHNHMESV